MTTTEQPIDYIELNYLTVEGCKASRIITQGCLISALLGPNRGEAIRSLAGSAGVVMYVHELDLELT